MRNSLGTELSEAERELVRVYEATVRVLRERGSELEPYQAHNSRRAVAALWQIVNGLDMRPGHLYDVGV